MKKILSVGIVLLLTMATVSTVFASDTHANIRADFYMFGERNEPDATGYAVINYVKGMDVWNVSGEVFNMRPGEYTLSVGTAGTCDGNTELVDFTVDEDGYAEFYAEVVMLPEEIDIARIYTKGNACITELTAPESTGNLLFRGSRRYESNREMNEGMGMPALHGVDGETFGEMVSELAQSEPGAVADHVSNGDGGESGIPAQHGMNGEEFGKTTSDLAKSEPGAAGSHASGR